MADNDKESVGQWRKLLWEFFVHVLVGAIIFILISAVSVGLNLWVHYLETLGIDSPIINGITGIEYLLFFVDCVLFVIFLFSVLIKYGREIWALRNQ